LSLLSCSESLEINEKIEPVNIRIKIIPDSQENLFHIFFQNIKNRNLSFGINTIEINDISTNIKPGIYNIYIYGFNDKTETSKKVYSYCILRNNEEFNDDQIMGVMKVLTPDSNIDINKTYKIMIYMNDIYDIFSVSSLSLKLGEDKLKSIEFNYNETQKYYFSNELNYISGKWYMNISYLLKSKIDENAIKKDNITISTSYFSNIYLGEF
jgi:hypothetical protein